MPVGERGNEMDTDQSNSEEALEAAVFRRLLAHMDERKDVQNIELMNLAGFCRNCLSKWYVAAAEERGVDVDYESAREIVYGMAYSDWKKQYQTDAKPQQMAQFEEEKQQS
tara:strand:+ start:306 stop:638 length:333 start_codon:yes stop_codon:yes gene_type:complete